MFTEKQIEQFISKTFGDFHYTGNNINVVCPICQSIKGSLYTKRKLAILHDKKTNAFLIKCWVCGFKARNLKKILKKYKPMHYKEYIAKFFIDNKKDKFENNNNDILSVISSSFLDMNAVSDDKYIIAQQQEEYENDPLFAAPIKLPEGFIGFGYSQPSTKYVKSHIEYLQRRGLDIEEDIWYWNIGYVPWENKDYRNRIIIPSYDSIGTLNYWTARSIDKKAYQKYKNPDSDRENIVVNELRIDWTQPLLIVEGTFDLIKTRKATSNATCLLGSELTSNYSLFDKIILNKTPIILCLDPDARKKQYQIAERFFELGNNQVKIIDLNNQIEDVGSITHNEFTEIYKSAIEYNHDYILRMKINSLQE